VQAVRWHARGDVRVEVLPPPPPIMLPLTATLAVPPDTLSVPLFPLPPDTCRPRRRKPFTVNCAGPLLSFMVTVPLPGLTVTVS